MYFSGITRILCEGGTKLGLKENNLSQKMTQNISIAAAVTDCKCLEIHCCQSLCRTLKSLGQWGQITPKSTLPLSNVDPHAWAHHTHHAKRQLDQFTRFHTTMQQKTYWLQWDTPTVRNKMKTKSKIKYRTKISLAST